MIKPAKHDKASKHLKSRTFKLNVSIHPFMLIAILAALAVIVLMITLFFFRFLK